MECRERHALTRVLTLVRGAGLEIGDVRSRGQLRVQPRLVLEDPEQGLERRGTFARLRALGLHAVVVAELFAEPVPDRLDQRRAARRRGAAPKRRDRGADLRTVVE